MMKNLDFENLFGLSLRTWSTAADYEDDGKNDDCGQQGDQGVEQQHRHRRGLSCKYMISIPNNYNHLIRA